MKSVFISIGMLVLIGAGGFFLYQVAYSQGETAGYADGYNKGHDAGQEGGYSSGEIEGYQSGEKEGYEAGYLAGKADGYQEGVKAGYEEGIEVGYEEGVEAGLGHSYTLRNPTYKEAKVFLEQDKTDKNRYVEGTYGVYVCSHFARDVCNNAEEADLRCAFVELRYTEGGHALIAFDTVDKGLVYFEPTTDEVAKPIIGKRYYECIVPKPGYYYEEPYTDDTIMDILVIW